jgi:hypothetical protein
VAILEALGKPEDIGPLYQAEAMVARARSSFSPTLILRTVVPWAMVSVVGFIAFIVGITGYSAGLAFLGCAILKPIFPDRMGAWTDAGGFSIDFRDAPSTDVLGWWLIPVCLLASAIFFVVTTRFLHWMLKFAVRRRSAAIPAVA